jgi:hypothetical protein
MGSDASIPNVDPVLNEKKHIIQAWMIFGTDTTALTLKKFNAERLWAANLTGFSKIDARNRTFGRIG